MGINFNSNRQFAANNQVGPNATSAKALATKPGQTTKVTIDGTTVVGTYTNNPNGNAVVADNKKISPDQIVANLGINFRKV